MDMKPMPSSSEMTPCAFPSLAVDPVTGIDPVLFRGAASSNQKKRFQRKPPVVDRAREYASSRSHAATRVTLERLRERHHELQIAHEEAFDREAQRHQFVAQFVETRLATCGVPTINSMDVRIQRERERVERLRSEPETATKDPSVVTRERIQRAVRETYGSRTLNLMALELTHVPREVFSTLLLQLGRFVATVNVSRNALRALPDAFIAAFPQIETLNVKENALDSLPPSLATLSSLRTLFAECNALRQLPPRGLPRSLERLVLSRNRLRSVPQLHTLSRLVALELTHNLLQVLPPGVDCLVQLRSMDVSSNQLVTLALLPRVSPAEKAAETEEDERALLEDCATLTPEQREREQKKWRVELDPETDERVYFHTETKQVTRVRPACFRPPVPTLPIGRLAVQKPKYDAMYPDGWDITLAGRSLVAIGGVATTKATDEKETARGASGESLQSMELRFVHHPTARSLDSLPPELDRWDQLKYLNTLRLAGNQLLDLPSSLGKLRNLRRLDVENNRLLSLPDVFQDLPSLETVALGMNRLSWLPPSFFQLPSLTDLDLKLNRFQVLAEELASLQRLTVLDVSSNVLESLPRALLRLKALTTLRLQNNPALVRSGLYRAETIASGDLPQTLWQLQHQVECETRGALPPATVSHAVGVGDEVWSTNHHLHREFTALVARAQQSRSLDFHWKRLTIDEFPASFFTTLASLRELRLSGHALPEIPASFSCFGSLRVLQLRQNGIRRLHDDVFSAAPPLEELDLEYNQLETLPSSIATLSSLRLLRAANNRLQSLPDGVARLSSLTSLGLAHNRLTAPPAAFGALSTLRSLDLSYNRLTTLATMAFAALQSLDELRVSVNQLTELPDEMASAPIRELHVAGNLFTTLPPTILSLRDSLERLHMQSNKIFRLPLAFGELHRLQVVEADGNPFRSPPAEVMSLGIAMIRAYLRKRQQRVDEISRLLQNVRLPYRPDAFLAPTLTDLIVLHDDGDTTDSEAQPESLRFLTYKHFQSFERAVDRYVNGAFYLLAPSVRGADLLTELVLKRQFALAQAHRERVLRDLVQLCALVRRKRWLDKVDFRFDDSRPWGRQGESVGVYMLNPRAVFDDQPELQLPSVLSVVRKRVHHGFEDEAFEHDEREVEDALTHFVGVYGPVGLAHDDVPFKCGCEELLRFHKHHEPCYRRGWTFVQVVYTAEEASRRERDEQQIRDALEALRPQILTFLKTTEGEKRFHKEVRGIKTRLRRELKARKTKLDKTKARHRKLQRALEKAKKTEAKLQQKGALPTKTLGEIKARQEDEERVKQLGERVAEWTAEYEKGRTQLSQGYHAFLDDVVDVLMQTIGVQVRNHFVRQQRQHAIERDLRRPWDGPNGRDFERFKEAIRRQMLSNGKVVPEEEAAATENGNADAEAGGGGGGDREPAESDNSEISDVSFDGYQDLVSTLLASTAANGPGDDDGDDDDDDDDSEDDGPVGLDAEARAEALAKLDVSDVSEDDDKKDGADSDDSDL